MKSGEVEGLFRTESELAFVSRTETLVLKSGLGHPSVSKDVTDLRPGQSRGPLRQNAT